MRGAFLFTFTFNGAKTTLRGKIAAETKKKSERFGCVTLLWVLPRSVIVMEAELRNVPGCIALEHVAQVCRAKAKNIEKEIIVPLLKFIIIFFYQSFISILLLLLLYLIFILRETSRTKSTNCE